MPRSSAKVSAHSELDGLEQRLVQARQAEREAEIAALAAESAVETARDEVREAHDLGANPASATKRLDQAKHDAEQAALAREGIAQRVQRATADRDLFIAGNGERLLAELRPECEQVADDLREHSERLLAAHARWGQLSAKVSGYLLAMNMSPADNAPGEHELTAVVRDLKRALANEIRTPSPHWSKRDADADEQATRIQLREEAAA